MRRRQGLANPLERKRAETADNFPRLLPMTESHPSADRFGLSGACHGPRAQPVAKRHPGWPPVVSPPLVQSKASRALSIKAGFSGNGYEYG
jgi:hypothetical protein